MATFNVQMPDGSVRQVQGTTLSAAINNAGAGASAPSAAPSPAPAAAPSAPGPLPQTTADNPYGGAQGQWSTINGPRTVPQMAAELAAANYGGATDPGSILAAYQRTTGGSVGPTSAAPGISSPAVNAGGVSTTFDPSGLLGQINTTLGNFSAQASGVTQAELAEKKRQFDETLTRQMEMWRLQGQPMLVIQQRAADLAEQEFESQKQLAQQTQALATAGVTGMYQGAPTMQAQQQAFAQEQARAGLGLQYLQSAAALGGPENVFEQSNFYRGAQGNPQVPAFLQNLASNTRMPVFQATGTPANVLSAGSIANQLTGGGGGGAGFNPQAALGAIQGVSNAGAQSLAPGSLERLTPDELAAFGSGLKAVGNSLPAFMQQYSASRLGQSALGGDIGLAA